ncbi:MAG: hypothetical protein ACRD4S_04270 [Candidatus Acidiferrales bacterium]
MSSRTLRLSTLSSAVVVLVTFGGAFLAGSFGPRIWGGKTIVTGVAASAPAQQGSVHTLYCGLWRTDGLFVSTMRIKNVLITQGLAVTPVIYMSDGTPYALPALALVAGGTATLNLNTALDAAPAEVRAHRSQFGSMALRFTSQSAFNVSADIQMLNVTQSLVFLADFQGSMNMKHASKEPEEQALDAVWWKHDPEVSAFLALSNTSAAVKTVWIEVTGSKGTAVSRKEEVKPRSTEIEDLEPLFGEPEEGEGNTGGIRIRYQGKMGEVLPVGGLVNESEGYSATLKFQPHSSADASPVSTVSYASVGMMAGIPDPMMKFPKTTNFTVYAVLRNAADRAIAVKPALYLMAGSQMSKISLPDERLAAGESRQLSLGRVLSNFSGMATLVLSYVGRPHDILLATGSVDQTGTYVFEVIPDTAAESWAKDVPYWSVADGNDTMISVFNSGDKPEDIVATLTYRGSTGHYSLPLHLMPGEQQMLDVGQLIEMHQPDADGNFIPFDVQQGSARFEGAQGLDQPVHIALASGIFNVQTATCGPPCTICVTTTEAIIDPSPVLTPVGGSKQATFSLEMSDGTQVDKTSTAHWLSKTTTIATVSAGLVKGVSVGSDVITAEVEGPSEGEAPECPKTCPIGPDEGSGPVTVQVPTADRVVSTLSSFAKTSATSPACPVGQAGWFRSVKKIVTDQNGADIVTGGQSLTETVSWTRNDFGLLPPSTGSTTTNGSGNYSDTLSFCTPGCLKPNSSESIATQSISDVFPGAGTYNLQPNTFVYTCTGITINGQ